MTTRLIIIRHGEYVSQDEAGRLIDDGLTGEGQRQVMLLRDRLLERNEFTADAVVASPLPRARQTAEILAPAFAVPIIYRSEVEEWKTTDGMITPEEFMAALSAHQGRQRLYYPTVEGGEAWSQFMYRACMALNIITQAYAGETVVIIAHGGIVEASFALFCGFSIMDDMPIVVDPAYASITEWRTYQSAPRERWELIRFNDDAHLH